MVLQFYLLDFVIQISPMTRANAMAIHGGVLPNKEVSILTKEEFSKKPLEGIRLIDVKTVRMIIVLSPRVCHDGLLRFCAFTPAKGSLTIGCVPSVDGP